MGFTYAIQVPVGKELDVKVMLLNVLERLGNPGIIAIHAMEIFEQTLCENSMSSRRWKAKLPGYIFVTTNFTERITGKKGGSSSAGLGMDARCWQLIKLIPMVRNILNRYIPSEEWEEFFDGVDLEPEIRIVDTHSDITPTQKEELKKDQGNLVDSYTHSESAESVKPAEITEPPCEEPSISTLIDTVTETLVEKAEEVKDQTVAGLYKLVSAVKTVVTGYKTIYTVPYGFYLTLLNRYRKEKDSAAKSMTAQSALYELKTLLKAMILWRT